MEYVRVDSSLGVYLHFSRCLEEKLLGFRPRRWVKPGNSTPMPFNGRCITVVQSSVRKLQNFRLTFHLIVGYDVSSVTLSTFLFGAKSAGLHEWQRCSFEDLILNYCYDGVCLLLPAVHT